MNILEPKRENRSLTTMIFEKIREDILSDVYQTDDKIVEVKLAQALGVSRTPVREALKQLETDGLVENIPNRGVVVKGISQKDIAEIYTIREAIESIAADWCIDRITAESIAELKDIYDLMEFYTAKLDIEKIAELNTRFHEIIYRSTDSRYLQQILKDFQIFIKATRNKSLKKAGRLQAALQEHKEIVEAIASADKTRAKAALVAHVKKSKQNIEA